MISLPVHQAPSGQQYQRRSICAWHTKACNGQSVSHAGMFLECLQAAAASRVTALEISPASPRVSEAVLPHRDPVPHAPLQLGTLQEAHDFATAAAVVEAATRSLLLAALQAVASPNAP
jgi:hypothetical protein